MAGLNFTILLKKLFKSLWWLFRVYTYFFCILSLGYVFNNQITKEEIPITFTFDYFSYIFIEGVLVTITMVIGLLCLKSTLDLVIKNDEGVK